MAQQNIFDNEIFFEGYSKIRERSDSANDLFEIPAMLSMMPDLEGKCVLDLGCGFGEHCKLYVERGAAHVVGIDISKKMLEVAKRENSDPKIEYLNMPMEDIGTLEGSFDVVVSSLALHYVSDFDKLSRDIYSLLNAGGVFLFSQEHPFVTSHTGGNRWTKDEHGNKLHLNLSNYGIEGEREATWFVEHVKIYHRTFSNIVNTLIGVGFSIEQMIEPIPTEELMKRYPDHKDLLHKPDFLLLRVRK